MDSWRALFSYESFWSACSEPGLSLRIMSDLRSTCRLFRESIPVDVAVRAIYEQKTCSIPKADAQQIFGLSPYTLRGLVSPVPFLHAFNIAWSRGSIQTPLRDEKVERKWAIIRSRNREVWTAAFQRNKSRLAREHIQREKPKRIAKTDEILESEETPELDGSRFSRLVWLVLRKHKMQTSLRYLELCAEGKEDFDLERAKNILESVQEEQQRIKILHQLDRLIQCTSPVDRERLLLVYLEKDGMVNWNVGTDGARGAYFENCLAGVHPVCMPTMRLHYAIRNVPWLFEKYQLMKANISKRNINTGKFIRKAITQLLGHRVRFDSFTMTRALPVLMEGPLF